MKLPDRLRRALPFLSNEALLLLLAALVVFRAILLDVRLRPLAQCPGCTAMLTAQHDAAVAGAVLLAFGLAHVARPPALRVAFRAFVCLVILAYGLDLLIVYLYNLRLLVADFFKYGLEVGGVVSIARHLVGTVNGIATLIVLVVLAALMTVFVRSGGRLRRRGTRWVLALGAVLLGIGLLPSEAFFAHAWAYRNVFEINADRGVVARYGHDFAAALRARHRDLRVGAVCSARPAARPDVILVVLEGFSAHHSRFFSGMNDLTPNLDRIASSHTAFTRFHANGFTTENGLIALLAGEVPIPAPGPVVFGGLAFAGFGDPRRSLPRLFEASGYRTAFLTTGDLAFAGKGAWLDGLGFHEIRGHDDPFYDGWPRMVFSAASDSALYLRALRWLEERPRDRPFFLVVETVSSHHPFLDPETRRESEPAVFRYADRQLGWFYDALAERGVIGSALLIVASDHRTMTPLLPAEMEQFGDDARALVPLVIADPANREPRRIEARFQQADLLPGIEAMLTGRSCPTAIRGDPLADPPVPPRCVMHSRGEDRSRVDLVCGQERAAVRLHGARTRVEAGSVPDQERLVDQINYERLERRPERNRVRQ